MKRDGKIWKDMNIDMERYEKIWKKIKKIWKDMIRDMKRDEKI